MPAEALKGASAPLTPGPPIAVGFQWAAAGHGANRRALYRNGLAVSGKSRDTVKMNAARLELPPDVTRVIREYTSDRVGIHPIAAIWKEEVVRGEQGSQVEWKIDIQNGEGNEILMEWPGFWAYHLYVYHARQARARSEGRYTEMRPAGG